MKKALVIIAAAIGLALGGAGAAYAGFSDGGDAPTYICTDGVVPVPVECISGDA